MLRGLTRRARLVLTAAVMALGAAPALAETLADALVLAYRNSNLLDQNQAVLRAADEDAAAALARLRPVLSYVAQAGYSKSALGEGYADSLTLSAQLTLLDFGRNRLGLDIAKETVLATREALVNVEQGVLLSAVVAYMDVKAAAESVEINQNSVRVIGEALRAAQDRFDLGEVTRTDVALAEARLAAARAGLAAAQGSLATAREAYKAATGVYPGALAGAPRAPRLPASLDEAKAIAQRNHPAILQAQRQVTVAELAVALAAAQRMPTVSLGASVSSDLENDPTGQVGLQMSQTVYAGGALSSAHRKAIAQRDAARAGLLQTSVQIAQQVGEAWANIAVTRAQLEAIDRQIEAATAAYEGTKEEAALGARTTLDVLNAEQELLDARADRISTEARLQVGIYSLLSAMGLLTAEHLNLGIPTYDPAAYYNAVKSAPATSVQGRSLDRVLKAIGKD
ncbi:MAG: TolC family outer membrane protein [Rhodobacteraceae bacterium]|nr:TolC family outer membrane protein [Paracoccaceae bacterium]